MDSGSLNVATLTGCSAQTVSQTTTTTTTRALFNSSPASASVSTYIEPQQFNRPLPIAASDNVTRRRVPTVRGREYTMDLLIKRSTMITRRVKQQIAILDSLQLGIDKKTIRSEVQRLDSFLSELDSVTTRLVETSDTDSQATAFRVTLEEIETLAVRAKQEAYKLISDSSSAGSSRRSRSSRSESVENWLSQSVSNPTSHLAPQSLMNNTHNSTFFNQQAPSPATDALLACLRQKLGYIEELQRQRRYSRIASEIEKVDTLHQELVDETHKAVPLLPDDTSKNFAMAQLDSMETQIYQMKESAYAYRASCSLKLKEPHEIVSTPVTASQTADTRRKVRISDDVDYAAEVKDKEYEAKLASLDAEISRATAERKAIETSKMLSELQLNTPDMNRHRNAQAFTSPLASLSCAPQSSVLTSAPPALAIPGLSGPAASSAPPYCAPQFSFQASAPPTLALTGSSNFVPPSVSQSSVHASAPATLALPGSSNLVPPAVPQSSVHASAPPTLTHTSSAPTLARTSSSNLGQTLVQLVNLQAAPKPTLDVFTGDPLKYIYFRTSFKDVVETWVTDERGRLNRLLTYTSGAARELVQTCVYLGDDECFTKAIELLDSEYGNKLRIARAFIKQLKDMENVKGSDPESWKKLYRFLLNCKTFKAAGNLHELDRPDTLSVIITKLDVHFQDRWTVLVEKTERTEGREVNFDDLLEFVKVQCARVSHPSFSRNALKNFKANVVRAAQSCSICPDSRDHTTNTCPVLEALSIDERYKKVFQDRLCFSCLLPISSEHTGKTCGNKLICGICWDTHPSILHQHTASSDTPTPEHSSKTGAANLGEVQNSMCVVQVLVHHSSDSSKKVPCYALLDQDCTGCFASSSLLSQFAPQTLHHSISVDTVNGSVQRDAFSVDGLVVRCSDKHAAKHGSVDIALPRTFSADNMPFSKEDMPMEEALKKWRHMEDVSKLVASFDETIPFGLIIGNTCKKALEPLQLVPSAEDGPYAYRTHLGWCVVGPSNKDSSTDFSHKVLCTQIRVHAQDVVTGKQTPHYFLSPSRVVDTSISDSLKAMYETEFSERFTEGKALSLEDKRFLEIMNTGVKKVAGHYEAPVPFRNVNVSLPNNKPLALHRLLTKKPKMQRDESYRKEYSEKMDKLIENQAQVCQTRSPDGGRWIVPHHTVEVPGKAMRVVFDCSAKFQGRSLNDELLQGPDLVNRLVGVLIRYRKETVAYSADLEACFHQINIPPSQRCFFTFLWWLNGDVNKAIVEYEMCVHIFGAISSPSIANYIIKRMGIDSAEKYGEDVRKLLEREFYVDNLLTSSPSDEEAISLLSRTDAACAEGGFNLRKVSSNSPAVVNSVPEEKRVPSLKDYDIGKMLPIEKALGVIWIIELDELGFRIAVKDTPLTRRNILTTISSIYDPLGLIAPFLLKGRKILQAISADGYSWDHDLQTSYRMAWMSWRQELQHLQDLTVKRCYKPPDFGSTVSASLHHFCDANSVGYGMATYVRQVSDTGNISVALVMGKSRVTPLKPITIPRLELSACALAAEVGSMVGVEIDIDGLAQVFWTDNKICLGYITNETKRFRIFVANRQQKIRNFTHTSQWNHVDTVDNPADHASRGISLVHDQDKCRHWFQGPGFLLQNIVPTQENAPATAYEVPDTDPELKICVKANASKISSDPSGIVSVLALRISRWKVMVRVMAQVYKFLQLFVYKSIPNSVESRVLSVSDLQTAELFLLRSVQGNAFQEELAFYEKTTGTTPKSLRKGHGNLWRLDPYVDAEGLLRVGGRIGNSGFSVAEKHPVILPKNNVVVQRILEFYHLTVQHGGRPATLNAVRSHGFWVLSGNAQVKKLIYHCVLCRKYRGRLGEQKMADLPEERIMETAPFTHCGVDLFGPFVVKQGRKNIKRFVALFTCFSSRAIHLEAVCNLTTDSFILALRRFLARRGPITSLQSDNGTNFVGADNEFRRAYDNMDHTKIHDFLLGERCEWIRWKRNAPEASHTGGVWERMIRSVRAVLTSLLHEHSALLSDEALHTLLTEAELIVNSRPLTTDTNDPSSPALSPIQLLTLKSKVVLPPPGVFQKEDIYCRKRWRHVQHLANVFWGRFRKEYLQSLQQRNKWNHPRRNFMVDDIVLLKDPDVGRQQWPMARVVGTFPGTDGLVRTVELRVASSKKTLRRPIQKLVLLVESSVV